jgi:hypothetical protein
VYVTEDKRLVAVPWNDGTPGTSEVLFRVDKLLDVDRLDKLLVNLYVVTDDGQRFLIAERTSDPNMPPIKVVVNWWASHRQ